MNYPGYTLVRREDCPEQHGVLTVLNHDVSGATVLLLSLIHISEPTRPY